MKPDLLNDPVPTLVRRIAVPASVGFFFNTMYNFVDTWCAGLLSTDALAALSLSFPVFFMLVVAGNGLGQGGTALIANALGRGDKEEARSIFAHAVMLAGGAGVVLTVVGIFSAEWLFVQLGAAGSYLTTALSYMHVILSGLTFFVLQMTLNSALSAQGDTKTYRNVLVGGFFANCLLNPWFMFGWLGFPAMGISGIALATVLIQVAGSFLLWTYIKRSEFGSGLGATHWQPRKAVFWRIATQAVPASLNMLTVAVGIFVITWFVSQFSKEAVAAYGIATRIEQVVLLPTIGLNFATLSLVGQNFGAGRRDRVREVWLVALKYGVGMMVLGGILVWLVRDYAMGWFTEDQAVIRHGADYLGIAAVTLCAYPILFVTVFMLQGLKQPAFGLWMGLYRQFLAPMLVFQALAFLFGWGIWGIWWGIALVTWSGALFALWWGWRKLDPVRFGPG
ncbi:MAG: MATE family efflux transporter [Verrucomicrobiaceae bacterium]|nr:MATE family efflux transporter [Verrucomicrobiaceae bacterium]